MIIDTRYIDVDLEQEARNVGIPKGFLHDYDSESLCRSYADVEPEIPESEWRTWHDRIAAANAWNANLVTRVFNQGNEGSCVGNAWLQMLQVMWARQFGKDRVVQMSASSGYKQIGRSPNSGAMISDALEAGREVGALPLDTPENRAKFGDHVMPHTGFRVPFPQGWENTALHFRFDEFLLIRNVRQLFSALLRLRPVVVGRAGHSILYLDLVWDDGRWLVRYVNSWGQWGTAAGDFDFGFGYDSSRLYTSSASYAWTATSLVVPPWETVADQTPVTAA